MSTEENSGRDFEEKRIVGKFMLKINKNIE
jgi:hypothetical protein